MAAAVRQAEKKLTAQWNRALDKALKDAVERGYAAGFERGRQAAANEKPKKKLMTLVRDARGMIAGAVVEEEG